MLTFLPKKKRPLVTLYNKFQLVNCSDLVFILLVRLFIQVIFIYINEYMQVVLMNISSCIDIN